MFINNWLRPDIKKLNSYEIANSKNMLKLDAMEMPFSLTKDIEEQLLSKFKNININRYNSDYKVLKDVIYNTMKIDKGLSIILGNGSDELIQLLMLACDKNSTIISFNPSFVMYEITAKLTKVNCIKIDLTNNFAIDLTKTMEIIIKNKAKIIFISYPNNPTANNFKRSDIEYIIKYSKAMVVIDEAYYAYNNDSFVSAAIKYDNLIILRTISKIGFAALRLGVLIAKTEITTQLDKLRMPYNINIFSQISGEFLLQQPFIKNNINKIINNREKLLSDLKQIKQLKVYPSDANFIFFKAKQANNLFNYLLKNNIIIKNLTNIVDNALRVTVSTQAENQIFLQVIRKFYV